LHTKVPKYAFCAPVVIYLLIYVRFQDLFTLLPRFVYGITTAHWHSRMRFIYQLINLSSKKITENRYSTNLAYPDHKYN